VIQKSWQGTEFANSALWSISLLWFLKNVTIWALPTGEGSVPQAKGEPFACGSEE